MNMLSFILTMLFAIPTPTPQGIVKTAPEVTPVGSFPMTIVEPKNTADAVNWCVHITNLGPGKLKAIEIATSIDGEHWAPGGVFTSCDTLEPGKACRYCDNLALAEWYVTFFAAAEQETKIRTQFSKRFYLKYSQIGEYK